MKILFLVPDGVGIRNYLYSSLLTELSNAGNEVVIGHALSEEALEEVEKVHQKKFHTIKLPSYKESIKEKLLREIICYARLRYNSKISSNNTILKNWLPNNNTLLSRIFYRTIESIASISSFYTWIKFLEKKYEKILIKSKYSNVFLNFIQDINPNIIFNTHQRSINAIPVIIASKKINCKTITAIYSWDNIPKARLNTRTDKYFVWSNYMKKELKLYYPEILDKDIIITGTPQFDFYKNKNLYITKKEFCKKFDLDIKKQIICFSGDDILTSPYDPMYLEDLAESIEKLEIRNKPQILFRRCPVDFSDRYDDVIRKYPNTIKVSNPIWNKDQKSDDWSLVYPSYQDVKLLVNLALYCDAVYNVGSTMAHDFAMFNKVALYINYDHAESQVWKTDNIYKFEHFKSMKNLDAVVWINSKEEISEKITKVLSNPELVAIDRKIWLNIINNKVENTSKIIAEAIEEA